jgi:Ca2+/H+ antiporter, TMEM165/GDT1 family
MKDIFEIFAIIIGTALIVGALMALPVMWLWNSLMPEIFGLQTIGFWQALGLSLLTKFLFGMSSSSSKS